LTAFDIQAHINDHESVHKGPEIYPLDIKDNYIAISFKISIEKICKSDVGNPRGRLRPVNPQYIHDRHTYQRKE